MEFGLREWMILISGLLIIVVIVDGVRRMLADRRHQIRMGMSYHDDGEENDDYFEDDNPELPNGGARVLASQAAAPSEPVIGSLNIDDEPPLREYFSTPAAPAVAHALADEPLLHDRSLLDTMSAERLVAAEPPQDELSTAAAGAGVERPVSERRRKTSPFRRRAGQPDDVPAAVPPAVPAEPNAQSAPAVEPTPEVSTAAPAPAPEAAVVAADVTEPAPKPVPKERLEEVLVINVIARDNNGFNGSDLLEVLLACDVRFGEMNIFHRYEGAQGKGNMQFSVANLVKPGTFDLATIKTFYTPGITFFMQLPGPADPLAAFNCMAEVASCMVRNLQGEMRDEGQSILTPQTLEHYRERIRNFERKRLMRANRKA